MRELTFSEIESVSGALSSGEWGDLASFWGDVGVVLTAAGALAAFSVVGSPAAPILFVGGVVAGSFAAGDQIMAMETYS